MMLVIIACSAVGMWLYQSWREEQDIVGNQQLVNVYMVKGKGDKIAVYSQEGNFEFKVKSDLEETEYTGLGDVYVKRGEIDKLVCKPDQLREKVLAIGEDFIELENYGQIPLHQTCSCFVVGKEIDRASQDDLYVGQADAGFVVAEGKICSVLLPQEAKKEEAKETDSNIRVMIKTDNFAAYEHAQVKLRGTKKIYVKSKKKEKVCGKMP